MDKSKVKDDLLPAPQDLATIVTTKPRLLVRHQQGSNTPNPPEKPNRLKTRPAVTTKSENEALATSAEAEIVIETPLRESDPLLQ